MVPNSNSAPPAPTDTPQTPDMQQAAQQLTPAQTTQTAPPAGQPTTAGQPAAPQAPPTPEDQHASAFKQVLATLLGGGRSQQVVRDASGNPVTDPATGRVKTQTSGVKQLGAGMLAGAIASMAASFQHMPEYRGRGTGYVSNQNESAAAGAEAGAKFTPQAQLQAGQEKADQQQLRQYSTFKQNMDMHTMAFNAWHQDQEQNQAMADAGLKLAAPIRNGLLVDRQTGKSLYDPSLDNLDFKELTKAITARKGMVADYTVVPVGTRPAFDESGKPTGQTEQLYMALNNHGMIKVTPEMQEEYPRLKNAGVPEIPVTSAVQLFQNKLATNLLGGMFSNLSKSQNDAFPPSKGAAPQTIDWQGLMAKAGLSADQKMQLQTLGQFTSRPDQFIAHLSQISPMMANAVGQQLGISEKDWTDKIEKDKKKEDATASQEAKTQELYTAPITSSLAPAIIASSDPNVSPARKAEATKVLQTELDQETAKQTARVKAEANTDEIKEAAANIVGGQLATLKDVTNYKGTQRIALFNALKDEAIAQGKDPALFSPTALTAKASMYEDYNSDKRNSTGSNIATFDTFLGHASDAMDATEAMRHKMTGLIRKVPMANQPLNWLSKNVTADSDYTNYVTALEPVRKEFMSFLNANRAEHTEDIQVMQQVLNDNNSPAQIENAIKQLGRSADIRLAAIGRKWQNLMGSPYPTLYSEPGIATLQKMGIKPSGYVPGQGPAQPNQTPAQNQSQPRPQLTNFQVNDKGDQIGWDAQGRVWRNVTTGQPVQ